MTVHSQDKRKAMEQERQRKIAEAEQAAAEARQQIVDMYETAAQHNEYIIEQVARGVILPIDINYIQTEWSAIERIAESCSLDIYLP